MLYINNKNTREIVYYLSAINYPSSYVNFVLCMYVYILTCIFGARGKTNVMLSIFEPRKHY